MYFRLEIYELERRAIFSRYWFFLSHQARYKKTGDFVKCGMAGFEFIIVKKNARLWDFIIFAGICRELFLQSN